ncbi:hypothetical protein FNV43_RR16923 [Rhamnella rubrinervis]|uniref:Polygalacturonase-like n=1 Tax=Rhamnella rubrinervis TaxID=2594499 RepID=A0A8K0GZQ2_9ROSA|nr:hypothetical protein FNV43_RR16923 [Rhamnella rubrinervis]
MDVQSLKFSNSNNIVINGVTSINSQMLHIVINRCHTNGIHVQMSTGVTILNFKMSTGDEYVSIVPQTANLWIEDVAFGPGHSISIGSLRKDSEEESVQNVTVKMAIFTGSQNEVRIKSWARPSTRLVRDILFQHAVMVNVENPIMIDQNYSPDNKDCPGQESGVKISAVIYQDIYGTSATPVAVKFDCNSKFPCTSI